MKTPRQMDGEVDELTGTLFEYVMKVLIGTVILLLIMYITRGIF